MSEGNREWERQQEHRATERELQAHFSGRRRSLRTRKSIPCEVAGPCAKFQARIIDVSRSGALVVIVDRRFALGDDLTQLMLYTARVWHHFPEGLELQIPERNVRAVANIVRVKVDSGQSRFPYQLGLHFRTELTENECDRLGAEHADDRSEVEEDAEVSDAFARLFSAMPPAPDGDES